jgi:Na+/H+-dicarboxylate symporter
VTVLFLAQFFGIELSLGQQFTVMLVCIWAESARPACRGLAAGRSP